MTRQHKSILFPEATGEKPSSQQPDCSHSNGKTQETAEFWGASWRGNFGLFTVGFKVVKYFPETAQH